jgi:hypothetical protein
MAATWRRRLPDAALATVPAGLLVVLVGVTIALEPAGAAVGATIADVDDWRSPIDALSLGGVLAAVLLQLWRPRAALGWSAATCALVAADPLRGETGPAWAAAALALGLVAVLDAAGATRQRVLAESWNPPVKPELDEQGRRVVLRPGAVTVVVAVVGIVGLVAGTGFWARDLSDAHAFWGASTRVQGTVVSVDEEELTAQVQVGDERVRVPLPFTVPSAGDAVVVLQAPGRTELASDVIDPAGSLVWAGLGAVLLGGALTVEARRRRQTRRVLRDGAPAVTMRVVSAEERWWQLGAVDDPGGRALVRVRVDRAGGPDAPWSPLHTRRGPTDDEAPWPDDDLDEDDRDVTELTDRELLEMAAALSPPAERTLPVPGDIPTEVVVVGLGAYGDWTFVRSDERWWQPDRPVRDASRLGGARSASVAPVPGAAAASRLDDPPRAPLPEDADLQARVVRAAARGDVRSRLDAAVFRVARRTPLAVVALAAPAIAWFSWWLSSGSDAVPLWRMLAPTVGLAWVGGAWARAGRAQLRVAREGIELRGVLVDDLVLWSRIERVVADGSGLVLRLTDDALLVHAAPGRLSPPVLAGDPTPVEAAQVIERARRAAMPNALPPRLRRVSAVALVGAAWVLAWIVPSAAVAVGLVR